MVLVAFHPQFLIKVRQMTIHSDLLQLKQLHSKEILIYSFSKQSNDGSTWPARWKADRSTSKSVRTLSVDRLLFWALHIQKEKVRASIGLGRECANFSYNLLSWMLSDSPSELLGLKWCLTYNLIETQN